jgi:predicted regulator of Ras-like GTPase activity (Roadblock/LC7/MglB family)
MNQPLRQTAEEKQRFNYLLDTFASDVPHVVHAAAATTDGLPLAATSSIDEANREQLCATISSVMAVLDATARLMNAGPIVNHMTNMDNGGSAIFQRARNGLVTFLVLVEPGFDIRQVQFQLRHLGDRVGEILNPGLRDAAEAPPQLTYRT